MKHKSEDILKFMERLYKKSCPLGVYILDYFIAQDLVKIADFGEGIEGVLIFKKTKLSNFNPLEIMANNPRGDCAYVLELCSKNKRATAFLECEMRGRLGKTKHLGMTRRGKVLFYDYEKFMNKLLGKDRII